MTNGDVGVEFAEKECAKGKHAASNNRYDGVCCNSAVLRQEMNDERHENAGHQCAGQHGIGAEPCKTESHATKNTVRHRIAEIGELAK